MKKSSSPCIQITRQRQNYYFIMTRATTELRDTHIYFNRFVMSNSYRSEIYFQFSVQKSPNYLIHVTHQSIETTAPRAPGHSGEFNISPVLKDGRYFPAPGANKSVKASYSGDIRTPDWTKNKNNNSNRHCSSWTRWKGQTLPVFVSIN